MLTALDRDTPQTKDGLIPHFLPQQEYVQSDNCLLRRALANISEYMFALADAFPASPGLNTLVFFFMYRGRPLCRGGGG